MRFFPMHLPTHTTHITLAPLARALAAGVTRERASALRSCEWHLQGRALPLLQHPVFKQGKSPPVHIPRARTEQTP